MSEIITKEPPRLIHYLGSKARLLEPISEILSSIANAEGYYCDLFSGSGIVSGKLSADRRVLGVDIQEYSRILTSVYLTNGSIPWSDIRATIMGACQSATYYRLVSLFAPLMDLEDKVVAEARQGNAERLAQYIEAGSIVHYGGLRKAEFDPMISKAFGSVSKNVSNVSLEFSSKCVISRYYGGLFFPIRVAIEIDAILDKLNSLDKVGGRIALAGLIAAASRMSTSVGNQFAQPIRPRTKDGKPKESVWKTISKHGSRSIVRDMDIAIAKLECFLPSRFGGRAIKSDYAQFLNTCKEDIGAFYIDPPYTRDHYSRFYHVLETICLRDEPSVTKSNIGDKISRGVYRADRHQSPFCIRSKAPSAFDSMFRVSRQFEAPILLSYSPSGLTNQRYHPRVVTIELIEEMAKKYFGSVEVIPVAAVAHSYLNNKEKRLAERETSEVFVVCRV